MPTVNRSNAANCNPGCKDVTAPPTPEVVRSMAFDRGSNRAQLVSTRQPNRSRSPRPRDPFYLELRNVEPGTSLQIINLSKKPDAAWNNSDDITKVDFTGRDVQQRTASVYLTEAQMNEIDLEPGDIFELRLVDRTGNASEAVRTEAEPNDWATREVRDVVDNRWVNSAGAQLSALDGEAARKNIIAKAVNDGRPPVVLENKLSLATDGDTVSLKGEKCMEPDATMRVTNSRTGEQFNGTVGADGNLQVDLKNVAEGDTLFLDPTDHEGHAGKTIELLYSKCADTGIAPKVGILDARLPGVI